ncbi:MAG TPA: lipocalin family protein [Flavobacteriaceae bacterium]|nr:lipocalin family protein [Flavobacteriaceae bacterium]
MKKIFLFLAISIALVSCNKDDDNSGSPASIAGSWNLTKLNLNVESTYVEDGITYIYLVAAEGTEYDASLTFSENPNTIEPLGSITVSVKSYLNGIPVGQEEQTLNLGDEFDSGTWDLNGSTLTVYEGDNTEISTEFTVETLTQNKLVITYFEEMIEGGITSNVEGRYEFSR